MLLCRDASFPGKFAAVTPTLYLNQGAQILGQKLYPLGFTFEIVEQGESSSGEFAVGCFKKADRTLTLSFRHELGIVQYRKGSVEKTHLEFMQAIGREGKNAYPGYSDGDKIAAFHHLFSDLEYCDSFLEDEGNEFFNLMKDYQFRQPRKGLV